jgi:hypothetical protein
MIEPSITTSSTHPVYCPFHSVLKYKLIILVGEILRKRFFIFLYIHSIGETTIFFFNIPSLLVTNPSDWIYMLILIGIFK